MTASVDGLFHLRYVGIPPQGPAQRRVGERLPTRQMVLDIIGYQSRFVAELVDSGQKARWPVCAIASGIRGVNRTWPFRGLCAISLRVTHRPCGLGPPGCEITLPISPRTALLFRHKEPGVHAFSSADWESVFQMNFRTITPARAKIISDRPDIYFVRAILERVAQVTTRTDSPRPE